MIDSNKKDTRAADPQPLLYTDSKELLFQSIADTKKTIAAAKPDLETVLASFAGVFEASQKVQEILPVWDIVPSEEDQEALMREESLLPLFSRVSFKEYLPAAAEIMLPALVAAFPNIADAVASIKTAAFETRSIDLYQCMQDLSAEDAQPLKAAAEVVGISEEAFVFVLSQMYSPFLRSFSKLISSMIDLSNWSKGYCPVCGALPSIAYLFGDGGKRWLHCSQCGHDWRFQRQTCPYCEGSAPEGLEYFYLGKKLTERAYVCKECKKYLLVMDIRELAVKPNMDLAPIGLIPLDIKAQKEGYAPIVNLPWNSFDEKDV